ncbi:MAG: amidase family protein, partial [Frankiaceae bacterium]
EATSALLEELGHEIVDIEPPASGELEEDFRVLWSVAALSVPCGPRREPLLRPLTRWLRELGGSHSAARYLGAVANLQLAAREAVGQLLAYDAILTPTLAQPPAPVGGLRNDADPEADFRAQAAFAPYPALANLLGTPAVNVPVHWTSDGLPIGSQLLGRPGDEAGLIRLSAQLEDASGWPRRQPPLW